MQIGQAIVAAGYRYHSRPAGPGTMDVSRGITDNPTAAGKFGMIKFGMESFEAGQGDWAEVIAIVGVAGKGPKWKIAVQAKSLQLEPSGRFEIAGDKT